MLRDNADDVLFHPSTSTSATTSPSPLPFPILTDAHLPAASYLTVQPITPPPPHTPRTSSIIRSARSYSLAHLPHRSLASSLAPLARSPRHSLLRRFRPPRPPHAHQPPRPLHARVGRRRRRCARRDWSPLLCPFQVYVATLCPLLLSPDPIQSDLIDSYTIFLPYPIVLLGLGSLAQLRTRVWPASRILHLAFRSPTDFSLPTDTRNPFHTLHLKHPSRLITRDPLMLALLPEIHLRLTPVSCMCRR